MKNFIDIASDFSDVPVGRFRTDGPNSGERFRTEFLVPALAEHDVVTVNLDGVEGFGSSFLEEAFGGVVRELGLTLNEATRRIRLVAERPTYVLELQQYMRDAAQPARAIA